MSDNRIPLKQFESCSSMSIPVLQFLYGLPFSDYVECFFRGIGANCYRIIPHNGAMKMDGDDGRVTVHLDEHGKIKSITVGITVEIPDGVEDGHDLYCKLLEMVGKDKLDGELD